MKKILLSSILIIITNFFSFGQSNETEPNNSFATANLIQAGIQRLGTLGSGDIIDYHKLHFNWNANFYLMLEVTNTGSNGTQSLELNLFNSLRINNEYVGNFYSAVFTLGEGESFQVPIIICGKAIDSFYLVFESQGEFEYNFEWVAASAYPDDGFSNNTPATATPFSFNVEKPASLKYEFWGSPNFDTIDYFISTLPLASYDSVYLNITAQNNSCANNKFITYACYKNGNPVPFASGFVGNNASVNSYQQVFSRIPLNNMQQGDQLLIKFTANAAFGYRFKYNMPGEFDPDTEDNCCINNAILLTENVAATGNVGEYDYNNDEFIDQYDTYRLILPRDGAFNLIIKARNDECNEEEYALACDILDKYGNELAGAELAYWYNNPACGEIITETFKFRAFHADTFYLRLRSDYFAGKISYNIKYQLIDSTASDANESFNDPVTTVLPINAGEVKKGHVRFKKNAYVIDPSDIYKITLPADGIIKVYLKATFRGDDDQFNNNNNNRFSIITTNLTGRIPLNPPITFIITDAVYQDSFQICGLGAGDLFFTLSSNLPYEYEFRYEIIDTSSIDNDVEPNNTFAQAITVGGGVTKKGHIAYRHNVTTDQFDYYKMIYTSSDSLKIFMQATNTSCLASRTVTFRGYNKNQVQIFSRIKSNVAPGQTVIDSVKIFVTAIDSIYLRVEADGAFKYEFNTSPRMPTSAFTIVGDSTACFGVETYTATNVGLDPVNYNWSLPLGGGSLTFVDSVATVTWNGSGNPSVQLYLSNGAGNSQTKTRTVVVDAAAPTAAPVISNFARTLSSSARPAGTNVQ